MSKENFVLQNSVRRHRENHGWSQQELAERAGLSRTGVSAIEAGRLIPSTAAALAMASAFGCRVEDIFALAGKETATWAWPPVQQPCRFWRAYVGARQLLYPVEASPLGSIPHDGIWRDGQCQDHPFAEPARTLVVACCDPAVGLLASEYSRQTTYRLLALARSSGAALKLLADGLIHAAGIHLGSEQAETNNRSAAAALIRGNFTLLRVADREIGLALAPGLSSLALDELLQRDLKWIGREEGSGARQVLTEISAGAINPKLLARDHRSVAQAVRNGVAQAGISVRLACEEEGVDFLSLRKESYDLCLFESQLQDPRVRALIEVVGSDNYRQLLSGLPGYENSKTGELDTLRQG